VIYELREYVTVPGRMPALVKRFNEHTLRIFDRLGFELTFISLTGLGDNSANELVYVLKFEDYGEMERKWATFQADPEWRAARSASEQDGPILAQLRRRVLNPTPFEAQ